MLALGVPCLCACGLTPYENLILVRCNIGEILPSVSNRMQRASRLNNVHPVLLRSYFFWGGIRILVIIDYYSGNYFEHTLWFLAGKMLLGLRSLCDVQFPRLLMRTS